jgi:predicted glycoside hydrolase/deacetylase ChbG (UPF0249 family)
MAKIIINADDFGLNERSTKGIIEAFKKGFITDTTACANGFYFEQAVNLAYKNSLTSKIGVHLNLTEGYPLTEQIKGDAFFCNSDGKFDKRILKIYDPLPSLSVENLKRELMAQIYLIKEKGITPTHADSHHFIHTKTNLVEHIAKIVKDFKIHKIRIAKNLPAIPEKEKADNEKVNEFLKSQGFITTDLFGGEDEYSNDISIYNNKTIEIMVHPSYDKDNNLIDKRGMEDYPTGVILENTVSGFFKDNLSGYSNL